MNIRTLYIILIAIAILLSIPLIAMQFTNNVNWSLFDFVIMGALLFATSVAGVFIVQKVSDKRYRISIILVLIAAFLLIWAELGIGVFGTLFAGS